MNHRREWPALACYRARKDRSMPVEFIGMIGTYGRHLLPLVREEVARRERRLVAVKGPAS